jgi:hypothetical protein
MLRQTLLHDTMMLLGVDNECHMAVQQHRRKELQDLIRVP